MSILHQARQSVIVFLARFVVPCSVVTHRLSDQRQRRLTWRERLSNRMHMSICVWCRRYEHQLSILHTAVHDVAEHPNHTPPGHDSLSQEARDRIRRALDDTDH